MCSAWEARTSGKVFLDELSREDSGEQGLLARDEMVTVPRGHVYLLTRGMRARWPRRPESPGPSSILERDAVQS